MKPFRASLVAALSLFAVACGNLETAKTVEDAAGDTGQETPAASSSAPKGVSGVFEGIDLSQDFDSVMGYNDAEQSLALGEFSLEEAAAAEEVPAVSAAVEAAVKPSTTTEEESGASEADADAAILVEKFDSNGDTVLDDDESAIAHQEFEEARAAWLESADADKDGSISKEEFLAKVKEMRERVREKRKAKILELFDLDKDGELSKEEREAVPAARKAQIAERKARLEERVKEFDTDGDGKLSKAEREALLKAVHEEREEKREERVKGLDKNKDGKLSDDEMKAFDAERNKMRRDALKKFDKNGNGRLDPEERGRIHTGMEQARDAFRGSFDKNGDGLIDATELAALKSDPLFVKYDFNKNGVLEEKEKAPFEAELRARFNIRFGSGPVTPAGSMPPPADGEDEGM